MTTLTLVRSAPCLASDVSAGDAAWLVVARSLDDGDGLAPSAAEVRAALATIARALRERGCGPERVLVLVKCIAHATLDARRTALSVDERTARLSRLVQWTIDAYYADA